jgi:Cu+-exporting ATPase
MEFLEKKGRTTIVVSINGRSEAVIGLSDTAREEAAVVIATLQKDLGVKPFMLTGDNARTAQAIASEIGIPPENVISDVLPEGKVDCIKKLQGLGEIVAMVGDGVNDSPAIVQADVGIAIGAGTDIAIETAGIVLMNSKLTDVLVAIDLSKTVFSRIKMNFVWALGYNTLAIPIAAGVLYPAIQMAMPPFMAAVAMILSSISVLISSLLLRLYRVKSYSYQIENEHITASGDIEAGLESLKREGTSNSDRGNETYLIYPGCTTQWQKPCSCPPNTCKCGNGCCAVSP